MVDESKLLEEKSLPFSLSTTSIGALLFLRECTPALLTVDSRSVEQPSTSLETADQEKYRFIVETA